MKQFLIAICIFLSISSFAQTGDPLRDKLDSIFQPLDKTQIPNGYLQEYGAEFTPMHRYNGMLTDSNVNNINAPPLKI